MERSPQPPHRTAQADYPIIPGRTDVNAAFWSSIRAPLVVERAYRDVPIENGPATSELMLF
jgi:hypothetical protein